MGNMFNTADTSPQFGLFKTESAKSGNKEDKIPQQRKDKGVKLSNFVSGKSIMEENYKIKRSAPAIDGFKKLTLPTENRTVERRTVSAADARSAISNVAIQFEADLCAKLIADTVTSIATRSMPDNVKSVINTEDKKAAFKEHVFDIIFESYGMLKKASDYEKMYDEVKFPYAVRMLYEAARNTAYAETRKRFDVEKIISENGLFADSLIADLKARSSSVSINDELLYESFSATAGRCLMLLEDGGLIESIKERVNNTIGEFKKNMETMDSLNKAIEPISKEQEPQDEKDAKLDNNPANADDGDNQKQSADNQTPQEQPPESQPSQGGDNTGNRGKEAGSDGNGKPAEPPEAQGAAGENPQNEPENKEVVPVSEADAAEIEDAAAFAATRSNTFNTGDEKFSGIRAKYSWELNQAVKDNDFQKLKILRAKVTMAAEKLREISSASGDKYSKTLNDFDSLNGSIKFNMSKFLRDKEAVIQESASGVFGHLIHAIKTRELEKQMRMEGVKTKEEAAKNVSGMLVANESCVYYTIFETLYSLKLMPIEEKAVFESFKGFMESL